MRVLTLCLGIGIILTAACSDGSKGGAGGALQTGGQGAGGVTALGGNTASSIPLTGACANLTCLSTLAGLTTSCQPSGTCTTQVSTTTGLSNQCFSNGVAIQNGIDMSTFATTMTVKNGGSVCYSMAITGILAPPMTIVFKDSSGTTVGTMGVDTTTNTMSVTCPGGTATVIDQSCGTGPSSLASSSQAAMAAQCDPGTCTF